LLRRPTAPAEALMTGRRFYRWRQRVGDGYLAGSKVNKLGNEGMIDHIVEQGRKPAPEAIEAETPAAEQAAE